MSEMLKSLFEDDSLYRGVYRTYEEAYAKRGVLIPKVQSQKMDELYKNLWHLYHWGIIPREYARHGTNTLDKIFENTVKYWEDGGIFEDTMMVRDLDVK